MHCYKKFTEDTVTTVFSEETLGGSEYVEISSMYSKPLLFHDLYTDVGPLKDMTKGMIFGSHLAACSEVMADEIQEYLDVLATIPITSKEAQDYLHEVLVLLPDPQIRIPKTQTELDDFIKSSRKMGVMQIEEYSEIRKTTVEKRFGLSLKKCRKIPEIEGLDMEIEEAYEVHLESRDKEFDNFCRNYGYEPENHFFTFHGTKAANNFPILTEGLKLPCHVGEANGASKGRGIYTAHTASYAAGYARNNKYLFVVESVKKKPAVVAGSWVNGENYEDLLDGADCFENKDNNHLVIFREDQVAIRYLLKF